MVIKLQKIEVEELDENDCGRVIELVNLIQPHIPWNEEQFLWQYFGRSGYRAKLYGAIHKNDLVGFYASVKNDFQFENSERDMFMVQDVMTAEEFRGQGILHLLGEVCSEAIDGSGSFGLTFPNEKSANSFRRLGWTEIMGVPLWEASSSKFERRFSVQISEVETFNESVSEIWNASALSSGIHRDAEYLNWRYSKPGVQYLKFIIGNSAGYLVLKLFTGDREPKLHLLDLVLKEESIEFVEDVLNFVFSTANDLGATSVTCWLPAVHKYESYFSKFGFTMISSHNRSIFVRSKSDQGVLLSKDRQWHFSQGDSDVF
jgi:GNAT superfamily N-acetyltransferase